MTKPPDQAPGSVSSSVLSSAIQNALQPQVGPQIWGLQPGQQQQVHFQVQNLPFPPPDVVRAYDIILPGSFDRIIKMAEKAQIDQTETIRQANRAIQSDTRWGQVLGSVVSVAAIAGAVVCAYLKQPWVSGVLVGVPVMAVARALIQVAKAPPAPPTPQAPPKA